MNIKVPASWLREYLKTDIALKTLANYLTLSGPSVEKIEKDNNDHILDVEVTSNRADAASIFGLAREAQAILASQGHKSTLISPKGININLEPDTSQKLPLNVVIKDASACPRFAAVVVDNVKIKPSPALIQKRLTQAGIRPINNIVDISNYLMTELGQPMHTFDYDKIKGAKMILRKSANNEKIVTLDKVTRKLPQGTIVIEDAQKLIDLCGIMGEANSQVTSRSKRIVFFVQAYEPSRIRKTTQLLGFRTEAAARFEKGIDLEGILPALSRAIYLAKQIAQAKIASELVDIYPKKQIAKTIKLRLAKLRAYLGIDLQAEKAVKILQNLHFNVVQNQNEIVAQAPSFRDQDIKDEVDLIEEISRLVGYHNLPSKLPTGEVSAQQDSDLKDVIELKKSLKIMGLTEIISYSIISKKLLAISGMSEKNAVELANPLTDLWQFMRPNLIPSLLEVVSQNQNFKKNLIIFEVARTYLKQKSQLPKQDLMLSIVMSGSNFYEIKGLVENVLAILKKSVKWYKSLDHPLFDKEQSAQIKSNDAILATVGLLNPNVLDHFNIEDKVAAAEINLTSLFSLPPNPSVFQPISKYPPQIEDLSCIFSIYTQVADVISAIKKAGEPLLKNIEIIDIFEDEKLGEKKKSTTFRLTFQKPTATPTQEEVTEVKTKIITALEKEFRAKVRK